MSTHFKDEAEREIPRFLSHEDMETFVRKLACEADKLQDSVRDYQERLRNASVLLQKSAYPFDRARQIIRGDVAPSMKDFIPSTGPFSESFAEMARESVQEISEVIPLEYMVRQQGYMQEAIWVDCQIIRTLDGTAHIKFSGENLAPYNLERLRVKQTK